MPEKFIYAFEERIGNPDLFTGRREVMDHLQQWVNNIEKKLSKSIAILARRKSGKTAIMQRLYNILWNENGRVIPFYIEIQDKSKWIYDFCWEYYLCFLAQYISFKSREPGFIIEDLQLESLNELAVSLELDVIVKDIKEFKAVDALKQIDNIFGFVTRAPNRIAGITGDFFVVMIDEFQYMNEYIFWDEARTNQAEGIVGGYHDLSESKIAPMCVAGSYVGWLRQLISKYFKGGRLRERPLNPRLLPEEGLECVHRYSKITGQPVTAASAVVMNQLTKSDPFYISSVFDSYVREKELETAAGVIRAFEYEISDRGSELNKIWLEYIHMTISAVNDHHARRIIIFLSQNREQEYTRQEIKEKLCIDMSDEDLARKLKTLVKGDLIGQGKTDYDYKGIPDDIFDLIFRSIYQKEIDSFVPDVKAELLEELAVLRQREKSLRGKLGNLEGHLPEFLISRELRRKKKSGRPLRERVDNYQPSADFADYQAVYNEYKLNIDYGREYEIDVFAYNPGGLSLIFELKNQSGRKAGADVVQEFQQKLILLNRSQLPGKETLIKGIFISRGGFTGEALSFMQDAGIMYADFYKWFGTAADDWIG